MPYILAVLRAVLAARIKAGCTLAANPLAMGFLGVFFMTLGLSLVNTRGQLQQLRGEMAEDSQEILLNRHECLDVHVARDIEANHMRNHHVLPRVLAATRPGYDVAQAALIWR